MDARSGERWLKPQRFIEQGDKWMSEEIQLQLLTEEEIVSLSEM